MLFKAKSKKFDFDQAVVFNPTPTKAQKNIKKVQKILKIFSKITKKKKRFYDIIHPMHVQCIKFQTHFKKENVMKKTTFTLSLSLVFAPR